MQGLSALYVGTLSDHIGPRASMLVGGSIALAVGALGLIVSRHRPSGGWPSGTPEPADATMALGPRY
jgi:hypothetical protein